MDVKPQIDLLSYYERYFREGMVDLSESSPEPTHVTATALSRYDLAYSAPGGSVALRRAIAARYETLCADDVVVTSGASEALAAVALVALRRGDMAVVGDGVYPTVVALAEVVGARTTSDLSDIGEARLVLLTNPSVPGGQLQDVAAWAAKARGAGALVVVDEVYRELALTGERASAACDIDERAVSVGDLSKPLGLGGLRIGWVATRDRDLVGRVRRQVQLLSGGPAAPSVAIAREAFAVFNDVVAGVLSGARKSAERTYAVLREFGWSCDAAVAGLTVLAKPPSALTDGALRALRARGWFLLPSSVFGIEGGFRISLLRPEDLRAALAVPAEPRADRGTLVVLTKSPSSGGTKTRLAESIGREATAAFCHAFVRDTLGLAAAGPWRTTVSVPSPGADEWLRCLAPRAEFAEQPDGDLGIRIGAALAAALAGSSRGVLIGSDTPDLPVAFVLDAFAALHAFDLVIGPAGDGGFYLLGARRFEASLLDGIEWSTATVCGQLLKNAERLGFSVALLPEWEDVDDLASLLRLGDRIESGPGAETTAAVLREWLKETSRVS